MRGKEEGGRMKKIYVVSLEVLRAAKTGNNLDWGKSWRTKRRRLKLDKRESEKEKQY